MELLCVCNLSSDSISIIDPINSIIKKTIDLKKYISVPIGPHNIRYSKGYIFVANNYSNSFSVYDLKNECFIDDYFVGMHCNDLEIVNDKVYAICGESNYVIVFDLLKNKIIEEIPCGNGPHNIAYDKRTGLLAVSNFLNNTITLIDSNNHNDVKNIVVGLYPTKVDFYGNSNNLIVCESYLGKNRSGKLRIIPIRNILDFSEIEVGKSPVDFFIRKEECFVSNFTEGNITYVELNRLKIKKTIRVGGMPRGIVCHRNCLFVGDNYRYNIIKINIETSKKKIIHIGKEPTGMILINLQ
ncbi:YncE family protein [Clostridium sp. DL1XJH146]